MEDESPSNLTLSWNGSVESVSVIGRRLVWTRADVLAGDQWDLKGGTRSQISSAAEGPEAVLEMPVHITYGAPSPRGWPQLILSVYGLNCWGSEVVLGYGRTFMPTTYGERHIKVPLFKPRPTTMFAEFMSWLTGRSPELVNPNMLADGTENYLLRTKSCGHITVRLNMISKGFRESNYDNIPGRVD